MTINKTVFKIILLYIFLFPPILGCSQMITGKVVRVADGDTLTLLDSNNKQIRIRLYGIDCPEARQDFGTAAKKFTSNLCFSKAVSVDVKDVDRYGRTVDIVWVQDTINVNLELLKAGLAWHYKHFDKSKEFANAESQARKQKIGVWSHRNAVAPWDFRRN